MRRILQWRGNPVRRSLPRQGCIADKLWVGTCSNAHVAILPNYYAKQFAQFPFSEAPEMIAARAIRPAITRSPLAAPFSPVEAVGCHG